MRRPCIPVLFLSLSLSSAEAAAPTFHENVVKVSQQPSGLADTFKRIRLAGDLGDAAGRIARVLRDAGISVERKTPVTQLRVGVKQLEPQGYAWWHHFESASQYLWVDMIRFHDEDTSQSVFRDSRQSHSGTHGPDYLAFFTTIDDRRNAVSIVVRKDEYLFNFGSDLPFTLRYADPNPPEHLQHVDEAIDTLLLAMEVVARAAVDPNFVGYIAKADPSPEEIRQLRLAGFAQMWSAVKHNFVFLDQRPNLDWDGILHLYLPRVAQAESHDEYLQLLREAMALLRDGHTGVLSGDSTDVPPLRIEPIEGRPIITAVGHTPELEAAGVTLGMEIVEVDGMSVHDLLEERYRYISSSTDQDRQVRAFRRLLKGPQGGRVSVKLAPPDGVAKTVTLSCNLRQNRDAAPWLSRRRFEFKEFGGSIAYVASSTFGSKRVIEEFDRHFEEIVKAKALIIDVRNNGGGSTSNGYAVISRLIDRPISETSIWRTRQYRPTFEAWGRPQEWHEGDSGIIEPRGEPRFGGPVAVLIGPQTFSAAEDFLVPLKATGRATLIGAPTGGSTGQPLTVAIFGTIVRVCTKWDRFPDGTEFVGVGVQPDIHVERTRQDVIAGSDPVLEKAIAFLTEQLRRKK